MQRTIRRDRRPPAPGLPVVLAALLAAGGPAALAADDEPTLLADTADAALPLDGATSVRIENLPGTIAIRASRDDEVRWMGRSLANRRAERALAVWRDGRTIVIGGGSDAPADEERFVEMVLSPRVDLEVVLAGGVLHLSALSGDVEVRGSGQVEARGMPGSVDIDLTSGRVRLDNVGGGATVAGTGLEVDAASVRGLLALSLTGGAVTLADVGGELDADLEGTTLAGAGFGGAVHITAIGGALRLEDVRRGGRIEAEGAPLELLGSGAAIEVDTDDDVQFRDLKGGLVVRGYGSNVRGATLAGALDVSSSDADVSLDEIDGAVRVRGDGLRVRMRAVSGDAAVVGASTSVLAEDVAGTLSIETDFGDVVVHRPVVAVTVTSRQGDVTVQEAGGPVTISADGDQVEVSWKTLQLEADCEIRNESGDVRLVIPTGSVANLRARAGYGTVVATAPGVNVGSEATEATAALGRNARGTITVSSGGSVYIDGPDR